MACPPSNVKFQLRRDTSSNWINSGAILSPGEPGFATDTNQFKIGNGSSTWSSLPSIAGSGRGPTGTIAFFDSLGSLTGSSALTFVRSAGTVTGTTGHPGPTNLVTLDGHLLPAANNTYSLGASGMFWKDLHVGTGTIFMGNSEIKLNSNGDFIFNNPATDASVTLTETYITNLVSTTIINDSSVQNYISSIAGPTGDAGPTGSAGLRGSVFFYGSSTGTLTGPNVSPMVGDFWIDTVSGKLYVKNA
jgi:hypothetical protein